MNRWAKVAPAVNGVTWLLEELLIRFLAPDPSPVSTQEHIPQAGARNGAYCISVDAIYDVDYKRIEGGGSDAAFSLFIPSFINL